MSDEFNGLVKATVLAEQKLMEQTNFAYVVLIKRTCAVKILFLTFIC